MSKVNTPWEDKWKYKPRKIEENRKESRNIGFEADMLIILKFPYNFFFTTRLRVHSALKAKF